MIKDFLFGLPVNGIIMLCSRNHGCKKQQKIIYLFHALSDQTSNKQYISGIFPYSKDQGEGDEEG